MAPDIRPRAPKRTPSDGLLPRRTSRRVGVLAPLGLVLASLIAVAGCAHSGPLATRPSEPMPATAMPLPVLGLQQQFVQVVKTVSPQVVQIQSRIGLGSGVVFDDRGDVVTNAHVVEGARRFIVTLSGGDRHAAALVGSDRAHDIAVVHVATAAPDAATFVDSPSPQVGDLVLAIGNPLGLRSSVTQGIVSSLNRTVSEANGVTLAPVIQTSAAIDPGNSGGALADLSGRVIGIPTLAALDPQLGGGPATGIGFAIPSATVQQVATRLISAR
jgi:putative serine protease PepD